MELNALADALSGLQANQTYMDVVGNNISNVNTTAFKTQNIHFDDLMSQTLSYGTEASGALEGTNPFQVGMGAGSGSVDDVNTQGSVQDTGRLTDMAIQGDGYFIVNNGQQNLYTRDGSFTLAPDGTLEVGSTGMTVQGWMAQPGGTVNTTGGLTTIKIPTGSQTAQASTKAVMAGNLNSADPAFSAGPPAVGQYVTTMNVYDSQGVAHTLTLTFQKSTTANQWNWSVASGADAKITSANNGTLQFDANGNQTPAATPTINLTYTDGTAPGSITIDFSKMTQVAQADAVNVGTIDGTPGGSISTFSVGTDGTITAVYSNGTSKAVGQIALASFRNPDGLVHQGNSLNSPSVNAGPAQVGVAGQGNLGTVMTGQLEGSNVDLAAQFGEMIQAQQGFNANTKVITTADSLLQSVIAIVQ